ncbi:MAG: histone deacetylase family protein [Spirochaetes bacterium]|nr:histone deacetylase family protein [Spirochaetota bacterium]
MKVVFHENFKCSEYASNSASAPGRMESIMTELKAGGYTVASPEPASMDDLLLAHTATHIADIQKDKKLFDMACLSAGGAILAAKMAFNMEPAFACIRPPGHHASREKTWDYCAFCNMGIALLKLKAEGLIQSAFVLDFDAHTGDGNINVLSAWPEAKVFNPMAHDSQSYIEAIEDYISKIQQVDIVAVSAGFDTYEKDLGKKLKTMDFYLIGRLMKHLAKRVCRKRRFALLEGGYYIQDLGKNVVAFCQGFD